MANTNIDYWSKILDNPNPVYRDLFIKEARHLKNNIPKDSFVLDIGSGNSRNIDTILPITKNITGIDIEESAVISAQQKFKDIPEVKIVKGSVFNMPFLDKSFDVAVLMDTLVNFEDRKVEALKEIKRVLRDDGKIILSLYAEDALENRLEQYKKINLPIEEISHTKVTFKNFTQAGVSEQFSIADIEKLGKEVGMKIENLEKIPGIAYIFEFVV